MLSLQSSRFRAVRRLAPPDAPCEATLASDGEDAVLLVDADEAMLRATFDHVGAEHVWAPLDISRTAEGHAVIMPRAAVSLEVFFQRRLQADIGQGEIVTLACSLLRGLTEARHATRVGDPAPAGRWWVTDAGKPMLILTAGESADSATTAALTHLQQLTQDRALLRALEQASRVAESWGEVDAAQAEVALCACAAPQAVNIALIDSELLSRDVVHTARAGSRVARDQSALLRTDRPSFLRGIGRVAGNAIERIREKVPVKGARVASKPRPLSERPTTADAPKPKRSRVVLVGVAVAALVLGVGALWPEEADNARGTQSPVGQTASPAAGVADPAAAEAPANAPPAPEPPADPVVSDDLATVASGLLDRARKCTAAGDCATILVDPARADSVPGEGLVELIDDYGGVAAIRVTTAEGTRSTVVIELRGEHWMINEIITSEG